MFKNLIGKFINFKLLKTWTEANYLQLAIFNGIMLMLVLLRSAGYFHPYFPISVNFIVMIGLILAIVLFKSKSRTVFIVSITFWLFAGLMGVLQIYIWAERTAIYAYQAIVIATILLIFEYTSKSEN